MQEGDGLSSSLRHLSFYRYFPLLESIPLLREEVRRFCARHSLRGTVVFASEGVNGMLAGDQGAVSAFRAFARERFGLAESEFKEMNAPDSAFSRLLVKEKKELSSVGAHGLRPWERTARRLAPAELRRWLDERRPLVLLDARNRYEVEVGTFQGAEDLGIDSSREFAAAAEARRADWQGRTVVSFCTGGIRCEKASAQLEQMGIEDVYQLDGGILRYFAECGGAHFQGSCFVFDWRLAVASDLRPVSRSFGQARDFGRHKMAERSSELNKL